jgi:hypothetical protein
MTTSEFGSASRRPGAPAERSSDAPLAAGAVDIQVHVLFGILAFEKQQLRGDQVGEVVVDDAADEDDPVAEEAGIDVVRTLAAVRGLDDGGDQGHRVPSLVGGTKPMRRRAGSAWFMARKAPNWATVRSESASRPEATARSWRRGSTGHAGSS